MMPFSTTFQKTGGVELAAQGLLDIFGQAEPRLLFTALFALTAIIGLFVSNTATAVLMAPIALTVAHDLGRPVSIYDDHRARRVGSVHDAGLIAGEYSRARAGALSLRRFRPHRRSIHIHCFAHHGSPRTVVAAAAAVSANSGTTAPAP